MMYKIFIHLKFQEQRKKYENVLPKLDNNDRKSQVLNNFLSFLFIFILISVLWNRRWRVLVQMPFACYQKVSEPNYPLKVSMKIWRWGIKFQSVIVYIYRALVSYPGSGNTWLRNLIEMMTGLATADERESTLNTKHAGPGNQNSFSFKI